MAKEGHVKMPVDNGAVHAAKFNLESLPGVKEILDGLTEHERVIVVNLVRMDNLAGSFEALGAADPRLFPAYSQVFELMESIAMDLMHSELQLGGIAKERYFELCDLSDKIAELAKAHAEQTVDASEQPLH